MSEHNSRLTDGKIAAWIGFGALLYFLATFLALVLAGLVNSGIGEARAKHRLDELQEAHKAAMERAIKDAQESIDRLKPARKK